MEIHEETLSDLALEHGIELTDPSPDAPYADIALRAPDWPEATTYEVRVYPFRLTPHRLSQIVAGRTPRPPARLLLAVPVASADFLEAAREQGVSVVTASGRSRNRGHLISADGQVLHLVADEEPEQRPATRPGRVPWATFAVALEFALRPARQRDIAAKLDITQGAVSQSKHAIEKWLRPGTRLVGSADDIDPGVRGTILRRLAAEYPRMSRTTTTTWMSLAAPVDAAQAASEVLTSRGVRHAASGQVAADRYAPWSRPARALIWADKHVDMTGADATPVPAADANLIVAVPEDPYLFVDLQTRDGLPVLAPERVWIDLVQDGDEQAAETLLSWLLRQAR